MAVEAQLQAEVLVAVEAAETEPIQTQDTRVQTVQVLAVAEQIIRMVTVEEVVMEYA